MIDLVIPAFVSCVIAFFVVFVTTPPLIKFLKKRNMAVKDMNKKEDIMVVRPGGPSIILGIIVSEIVLYAFLQLNEIIALIITTSAAFAIGYVDDRKVMGGWFKPVTLAIAAIPIIAFGAYDTDLAFPLFGDVQIPLLYIGLVLLMIPITGNTINSIDVLNGVASGFMVIASFSLSICLFIVQNYEIAIVSLPLGFVSLAFYKYHKIPSRIFPGDSGALTLGAMYGTIAIIGGVEIIAAVALLPAVINSFLFLSSVKKIVEHRQIKGKPVEHTEDFKLKATDDKTAPVTLVRLLLAGGPLSEKQIGFAIFKLGIFSGILAVITAFMMGVSL
ncbi:UDP-N-acetylglucosamine--dolichyl-phosphate N-acetylglucosaminephosphotransferase protein [Marine Group I thaumarchaeote SCGC AAA799-E16]|uniref:UDP-N-acetylglucosamine--dolichyl-phosphate N-acetylglucosaminephosphotransferase protein n=4 Tax=Marine Group I TaxID=905826 RepID=A0A081RLH7_9ARCH|nr:UDP-N-acetylglucosamine--dolichyl-phosphate N-acetylglucosaminephosphotransferase protein [Marine Group I thaumarchaeote SCGC AAA799-N04]KER07146.1 UDP-N-acetylglucosamine--dolichyl-phosphate N-acetylglucosaminephosphotransferase protein [Marine Group I thaumarchaeote SCGC AAA799-E16]KFM17318.1 UDP-N-acetylglucosamine--dolichyl-phosphate N-acetylglucosaminephosphotransferase protein [Marine Group I thaumarchaeote SCGC AAA799-D11]KFM19339.1 UDP-N-acetylglucosamine--dolichyl-phosphate N-acetylg